MTEYHKNKWKCHVCYERPKTTNSTPKGTFNSPKVKSISPEKLQNEKSEHENYVINVSTVNSFDSLSTEGTDDRDDEYSSCSQENDSQTEEVNMNRSCPDLGNKIAELEEMKDKNNDLEAKLQIAENEIDALLSENCTLKKQIKDYEKKIHNLTTICKSRKSNAPSNSSRRQSINKSRLCSTQPLPATPPQRLNNRKPESEKEPTAKNPRQMVDSAVNTSPVTPLVAGTSHGSSNAGATNIQKTAKEKTTNTAFRERSPNSSQNQEPTKLCLISSNVSNKILQIAENNLEHTEICHYKTPGAGIYQLLNGIENKLKNFTIVLFS